MHDKKGYTQTVDSGMILMDLSFKPLGINREAAAILSQSRHADGRGEFLEQMPAPILDLVRNHKASDLSGLETYFRSGKCEYVCRAYLMEPLKGVFKTPIVAIHFERYCEADDVVDILAVRYRLTNREREALRGISLGLSSKGVAARMNISPNTARAFSRLIMIKMNVRSRAEIAAKLLQAHAGSTQAKSVEPDLLRARGVS